MNRDRSLESWQKDVGPGWANLVEQAYTLAHAEDSYPVQIKEKYGGLRFYVDFGSDELHDAIWEIERESYKTCEYCGRKGKPRRTGWIKTLCIWHYSKWWVRHQIQLVGFRRQQRRLEKKRRERND